MDDDVPDGQHGGALGQHGRRRLQLVQLRDGPLLALGMSLILILEKDAADLSSLVSLEKLGPEKGIIYYCKMKFQQVNVIIINLSIKILPTACTHILIHSITNPLNHTFSLTLALKHSLNHTLSVLSGNT